MDWLCLCTYKKDDIFQHEGTREVFSYTCVTSAELTKTVSQSVLGNSCRESDSNATHGIHWNIYFFVCVYSVVYNHVHCVDILPGEQKASSLRTQLLQYHPHRFYWLAEAVRSRFPYKSILQTNYCDVQCVVTYFLNVLLVLYLSVTVLLHTLLA